MKCAGCRLILTTLGTDLFSVVLFNQISQNVLAVQFPSHLFLFSLRASRQGDTAHTGVNTSCYVIIICSTTAKKLERLFPIYLLI